ncbi:MAG: cellulose biosynthesis protein BcsS [Hyphomicrobiales bacterium]
MSLRRAVYAAAEDEKGKAGKISQIAVILSLLSFASLTVFSSSALRAANLWVMGGIGGSGVDTFHVYSGIAYSPLGHLHEEGPIFKGFTKNFHFAYDTELAPDFSTEVKAMGYGVEGLLGYQFTGAQWRAAAYGGVAWRDYTFTPHDRNNKLLGKNWGAIGAVDG